jgi:hypothetical protein
MTRQQELGSCGRVTGDSDTGGRKPARGTSSVMADYSQETRQGPGIHLNVQFSSRGYGACDVIPPRSSKRKSRRSADDDFTRHHDTPDQIQTITNPNHHTCSDGHRTEALTYRTSANSPQTPFSQSDRRSPPMHRAHPRIGDFSLKWITYGVGGNRSAGPEQLGR